jgi:hypothetical protein
VLRCFVDFQFADRQNVDLQIADRQNVDLHTFPTTKQFLAVTYTCGGPLGPNPYVGLSGVMTRFFVGNFEVDIRT